MFVIVQTLSFREREDTGSLIGEVVKLLWCSV